MTELPDMRLIPPLPSPWYVCDIDGLLQTGNLQALDLQLTEALTGSLTDRDAEGKYLDAFPADLKSTCEAGAAGLARLRTWQAQRPDSGHAHFCEAHYWYHWAYEFRGADWASTVTAQGWALAHACTQRAVMAGLRALELEPRLWAVPALLLQLLSSFESPEWLQPLLSTGSHAPHCVEASWLALKNDEQDGLHLALRSCGLDLEPKREGPTQRPAALISSVQNRRTLSGMNYWMKATLSLHPTAYYFMRQCVWFMQPRWGGSHDRIRSFLLSPQCAHLNDEEKDRLLHEIWRDDYLEMKVDADDDEQDVQAWRTATRQRMQAALYPYHRWEAGLWLANSHRDREEPQQALKCLQEAERHHAIDSDLAMATALWLVLQPELKDDNSQRWLLAAADRAAQNYECPAALVLLGYCTVHGLLDTPRHPAKGLAWLEAARNLGKGTLAWNRIAHVFAYNDHPAAGFEIATAGVEAGGTDCDYLLGVFHLEGVHVPANPHAAIPWFRRAMEAGGNMSAFQLSGIYVELANAAKTDQEAEGLRIQAIEAARRAHEMKHTEGLALMLSNIGDLNTSDAIAGYLPVVREHAGNGNHTAMAALSNLLAKPIGSVRDYNESVRWMLGAQAIAPDDEYVQNVFRLAHQDGLLSRALFKLTRAGIKPHEIPGVDNRMV